MLVTALNPKLGYDKSAEIKKHLKMILHLNNLLLNLDI